MKHRILVAEDESSIREGILTAFSDNGYEVVAAATGRDAAIAWSNVFGICSVSDEMANTSIRP